MQEPVASRLPGLVERFQPELLTSWVDAQLAATTLRRDLMNDNELREESVAFLESFKQGLKSGDPLEISAEGWAGARDLLSRISRTRSHQGFSPGETATFVFSLKQPLFTLMRRELKDESRLVDEIWTATALLDRLGLFTAEEFIKRREEMIMRQQQEMMELSTPVVQLWKNVLALPLIGTLDSARTQVVMERLLEEIVRTGSAIAILDITGVPTVDTLVAQHLMKTVAAARLMGADCIISGIRPQIAQTIVHLGVDLGTIITKATLADAFALALRRTGNVLTTNGAAEAPLPA